MHPHFLQWRASLRLPQQSATSWLASDDGNVFSHQHPWAGDEEPAGPSSLRGPESLWASSPPPRVAADLPWLAASSLASLPLWSGLSVHQDPGMGSTWVTSLSQDLSFSHIYKVFAPKGIVTGFRGLDLSSLGFLLLRAMMCVSSGPLPASLLEEAPAGDPVRSSGEPTPGRSSHALAGLQRGGQSAGRHVGRAETCPMPTPDPGARLAARPGRQLVRVCPRRAGLWRSPRVLPARWPTRQLCVLKCNPKYSFNTVWETFFLCVPRVYIIIFTVLKFTCAF